MNFTFPEAEAREPESETYTVTYTRHYVAPNGGSHDGIPGIPGVGGLRVQPVSMEMHNALSALGLNPRPPQLMAPLQNGQQSRAPAGGKGAAGGKKQASAVSLGVIRLDYDYPPAPGDIDCPETYDYDVFYRVVPGLTFSMCQSGRMTDEVRSEFIEAVKWLDNKGVTGITGDCGFMFYFQALARQHTKKPVFMSALCQLPAVTCAYAKDELICIMTANGKTLRPMRDLIKDECGVDPEEERFVIVGCEEVPGFQAVAEGGKVDVQKVTPGMVAQAKKAMQENPGIRAILLECTELPPYADALRAALGIPVYDAITGCDYFLMGLKDNKRFGVNNWQQDWDGQQDAYKFGQNLDAHDRSLLMNHAA